MKHVLLRAKGRVALRRLGSSTASSHNQYNPDHLGDETSSTSSSISCKTKGGDEHKYQDAVVIGPNSATESPLVSSSDTKSDNSYDDEDDAFNDSNSDDDDTDQASSPETITPAIAPTILPTVENPTAPAVPPSNSMTRNADDSTAATATPPESSRSGDVPNVSHRQQASTVLTLPRTPPLSSVAMTSAKEASSRDGDVSTEEQEQEQGRVAHPTGGSKSGCGDEAGKLRRQAVPVSARR